MVQSGRETVDVLGEVIMDDLNFQKEVLAELKHHSEQNDRIIELLSALKQPSRQTGVDVGEMIKVLKGMGSISKNPARAKIIEQVETTLKKSA